MKRLIYAMILSVGAGCAGDPIISCRRTFNHRSPRHCQRYRRCRGSLDPALHSAAKNELFTAASDNDAIMRANAVEAMQDTLGTDAADTVLKVLDDPDPLVRFAAAMAAGKLMLKPAYGRLTELADDPDTSVKVGAC